MTIEELKKRKNELKFSNVNIAELEKRQKRIKRLEQLGEHPTTVTEEEYVNPYKLEVIYRCFTPQLKFLFLGNYGAFQNY